MKCLPLFLLVCLSLSPFTASAATVDEALAAGREWRKLYQHEVETVWLNDDECWCRVRKTAGVEEYVRVNARTGERRSGPTRESIGLPTRETLKTSESDETEKASDQDGGGGTISFLNQMQEAVQMAWIDRSGKHHRYAQVQPGGRFRQNTFGGHVWLVQTLAGKKLTVTTAKAWDVEVLIDGAGKPFRDQKPDRAKARGVMSPDGRWAVSVEQGRLMLREVESGQSQEIKAAPDIAAPVYAGITWAPDSASFALCASAPVARRKIMLTESSPKGQLQPKWREKEYVKPGDELSKPKPLLVRLTDDGPVIIAVETKLFANPFIQKTAFDLRWAPDSREFYFDYNERGHQRYCILAVSADSGAVRTVVEETSRTFIDHTQKTWRHWLDSTGELLWMSERDAWCHLWLLDAATGVVRQQVTRGPWVVRTVENVDAASRQLWFMAGGMRAEEDPYHQHLCRVALDGSGLTRLTEGDGNHVISWSPNKKYFIDSWSRADKAPETELRDAQDGRLIAKISQGDPAALLASGWQMPERFVAKARDGKTDIHGVIIKPRSFDPARKYPIVEQVYAGPHGAFSPKDFGLLARQHELAELGFVVVQSDGMGTNHRGKAFHDVCWKNLKDAGFPDRMAWIRAAAATRPWMDLERVGIYGGSAGGQSAMRALLDHHDFYKAAVADCGCHDNRMDKIWWNEQWMGWPVDDSYKQSSNVEDAAKLKGELLLIVGETDENVDPASTYQVVDALQKAGKKFNFMPIMGTGHSAAETPYGSRLRMEFLHRHLKP